MAATQQPRQSNRRRSRRGSARSSVRLECRKGSFGFGANVAASVLDISDTGARMIITVPLEARDEVEISIQGFGLKGIIKRQGTIRWQVKLENGHYCVGIEFQKSLDYRIWQNIVSPNSK